MKLLFALVAFALFAHTNITSQQKLETQQKLEIKVVDGHTNASLPFASIVISPLNGGKACQLTTDADGKVSAAIAFPVTTVVTSLGYETKFDTLTSSSSTTISLVPKFFSIQDVVVTGQSQPIKSDKSIYAINVISPLQHKEMVTNNLTDVLSYETNIRITPDLQTGTSVSMQGLSGEYVKYMVNGVPINGRLLGNIDISQITMGNVDHIEIVEGPLSVIYGNNALAGTINIITRDEKSDGISLLASTFYESVVSSQTDIALNKKKGKNGFGLAGDYYYFGGAKTLDSLYRSSNWNPKNRFNSEAYYQFTNNDFKVKTTIGGLHEKITDLGEPDEFNNGASDSYYITNRADGRVEAENKFNENHKVDGLISASYYNRNVEKYYNNFNQNIVYLNAVDTTTIVTLNARGNYYHNLLNNKLLCTFGFDALHEDMVGNRITDKHQNQSDYALYATALWKLTHNMSLQPGLRYIYNTDFDAPVLYSLNYQHTPLNHWNFRTSIARGFRAPSLKELYMKFIDPPHNLWGNPELNAETSMSIYGNILYSRTTPSTLFEMEVKGFYNDLSNKIEISLVSPSLYQYINIENYKSYGGGVNFKYRPSRRWLFKTGFTTTGSTNSIAQNIDSIPNTFVYTDVTAMTTYTNRGTKLNISLFYRYNGNQQIFNMAAGIPGVLVRDGYHTMDFTIWRSFWKNNITATIGAKNLLNNTNIDQHNTNGAMVIGGTTDTFPVSWGRSYFIKIALNLSSF